ncbi:MAG: cobyrinate a,c-diamide synthase [Thermodesulfobacteriota bacterium]
MASGGGLLQRRQNFGRLLISSPQGRSGKTIVTVGLCDVLKRRGLSIQPFKKGPDYIDPSWLTLAAGRSCRNLDFFLIPKEKLIQNFEQACDNAHLAIVEGAMGLYDGLDTHGTTAEIARLLDIPILLVVNTTRMTGSIAAMVTGYQHFQKGIRIAGVILNYVSGSRHEKKLKDAVEQYCGIPVVGSIPKDQDLLIMERHLGLIPTSESGESKSLVERISRKLASRFDLDKILSIARSSKPLGSSSHLLKKRTTKKSPLPRGTAGTKKVRIGIIRDRAFNFYYPENLEALVNEGAELLFIDSFKDRLPKVDGLYIGGGFPEFFLKEVEGNRKLRQGIAKAIHKGLPVYAECAGLMYLCQSISWKRRSYKMVGVIPSEINLSERPEGHGYVVARVINRNPFFPVGLTLRGHEFHHSSLSPTGPLQFAYQIERGEGIAEKKDGIVFKNLFASYVHLHALGTPEWAKGFVGLASKGKVGS